MKKFKNDIRASLLGQMGKTMKPMDEHDELDSAIIMEAENRLSDAEWLVFFYGYHCCADWHEVHTLLIDQHGRARISQDTVERYARRAAGEVVSRVDAIKNRMK